MYDFFWRRLSGKIDRCDTAFAELFRGRSESSLSTAAIERSELWQTLATQQKSWGGHLAYTPPTVDGDPPFLEYDCKHLGLRQISFALVVERFVVGLLTIHGVALEGSRHTQLSCLNQLFEKGLIEDFEDGSTLPASVVQARLVQAVEDWCDRTGTLHDAASYHTFLNRALKQARLVTKALARNLESARLHYVNAATIRVLKTVRTPPTDLAALWRNVELCLRDAVRVFNLKYFLVFGPREAVSRSLESLPIVAAAGDVPPALRHRNSAMCVFPGKLADDLQRQPSDSCHDERVLDVLSDETIAHLGVPSTEFRLITVPVALRRGVYVSLLLGYHEDNPASAPDNSRGGILDQPLRSLYSLIAAHLSSILADAAERRSDDILVTLGHETAQLTMGLQWLTATYLSNEISITRQSPTKLAEVGRDLHASVQLLFLLHKQAGLLAGDETLPRPERREFLPLNTLLYKWKDIFRAELDRRRLRLILPPALPMDFDRPAMYADPLLLDMLLYNLIGNAVKYAYLGTRIIVDCTRSAIDSGTYVLEVSNYGIECPTEDVIYEKYERRTDTVDGLGVGLFIVTQIAKAHGGTVRHESSEVAPFNVPLAQAYLDLKVDPANWNIQQHIKNVVEQKFEGHLEEVEREVVARDSGTRLYTPGQRELVNGISRPTFRVRFFVELPEAAVRTTA